MVQLVVKAVATRSADLSKDLGNRLGSGQQG